jgi:hypothetical protein
MRLKEYGGNQDRPSFWWPPTVPQSNLNDKLGEVLDNLESNHLLIISNGSLCNFEKNVRIRRYTDSPLIFGSGRDPSLTPIKIKN